MIVCPMCHTVLPNPRSDAGTPPRYFAACRNCRQTTEFAKRYHISLEDGCAVTETIYYLWYPIFRCDVGFLTCRETTDIVVQDIIDHINELADRIEHLQSLQEADE